ncbi:Os05g0117666 [Oryza sativa Japonica Group]|uniref:Os05g0117666 protein n=1 Tax=Oryza sativa subsp. japonica TaxID=39947 RepID=C7J2S7_ORYSJ|nr:Os05g0117666 [Oryza sativa Japonica Group]|eukprot:NP_001174185.1 Os05g0117666 [Oryza sativa Japonica Group]
MATMARSRVKEGAAKKKQVPPEEQGGDFENSSWSLSMTETHASIDHSKFDEQLTSKIDESLVFACFMSKPSWICCSTDEEDAPISRRSSALARHGVKQRRSSGVLKSSLSVATKPTRRRRSIFGRHDVFFRCFEKFIICRYKTEQHQVQDSDSGVNSDAFGH